MHEYLMKAKDSKIVVSLDADNKPILELCNDTASYVLGIYMCKEKKNPYQLVSMDTPLFEIKKKKILEISSGISSS